MFKLQIETGNDAFADGNAHAEIARILREAASKIEGHADGFSLRDVNGNKVGFAEYDGEAS